MDSISDHYYKYNKTFLAIISAWPYDKKWSKQILRICICILLASGTVFQLTTCVKLKCTGDVLLKILPYVIASLIFLLKYVSICYQVEVIVYQFEQMERNWHILRDEQEITILKQYSEHSRLFSLVFATLMYAPLITFIFHQFLPNILDILLPLNASRPHNIPVLFDLWPYDKKWSKQISRIFICILLASGTVFQLTTCMKLQCTEDVLLKILPYAIASLIFLLKYVSICFKVEMIVYEFEQMERNWRTLRDEQEITILKQYSEHSRLFSLVFATLMYAPLIAVIFYQCLPDILDFLLPLNESRLHKMPVLFEYFLDQEKYFYLLILHANLMVFMGTTAIIASETMTTLIMYHICAFLKIISYRLQFVFDQKFFSRSTSPATQCTANEKLIDVIKTHRNVIEFGNACFKSQSTAYFLLLSLGIISISLCLYRVHQAISPMDDLPELLNAAFLLIANLIYLFLTNFLGQTVMDHSSKIFTDIYCTPWYTAALPAQHTLLFAMQKTMQSFTLSVGGVFVACFEGFAMIMRLAMSYFMALRSVQQ
ncbi:hypothetical protein KM043_002520 [Ampulex compressa]|nr:hypothetical protein KM043_002520 [Ampulex compressa]KAG7213209.1 hypothetical protein KM043_002520 [Ampulex compressa]